MIGFKVNSMFTPKMKKQFDSLAQKTVRIEQDRKIIHQQLEDLKQDEIDLDLEKNEFVNQFYQKVKPEEIYNVLEVIKAEGHPLEKREAEELLEKYKTSKFEYNDLQKFELLYRSNCERFL